MKVLSSSGFSSGDRSALKSAWKGLSKCVCASSKKSTRTKSPFCEDDGDEDFEQSWLLSTQPAGLNNLPEVQLMATITTTSLPWRVVFRNVELHASTRHTETSSSR